MVNGFHIFMVLYIALLQQCSAFCTERSTAVVQNMKVNLNFEDLGSLERRRRESGFKRLKVNVSKLFMNAETSAALNSVSSPLVSVLVLASIVLVHEAGHFLAATSMNIKVEEFSVGVGPKFHGYKWKGKEVGSEIDFSLRLLPFGGYVRFPDNYHDTTNSEQNLEQTNLQTRKTREKQKSDKNYLAWLKKKSILGSISRGESVPTKDQDTFSWITKIISSKKGRGIKDLNEQQLKLQFDEDPNLLQNRPIVQRAIVLCGGIIFNLMLAFSIYFGEVTIGDGIPSPVFERGVQVKKISNNNGPAYGILNPGDVIVGYNGHPLTLERSNSFYSSQNGINELISAIHSTKPNNEISLTVIPRTTSHQNMVPLNANQVSIKPQSFVDASTGVVTSPPSIGVLLAPNYVRTNILHASSIQDALKISFCELSDVAYDTAVSLWRTIIKIIGSKDLVSSLNNSGVSGPIGVIRMGSDVVSSSSFDANTISRFAAAISINLAVINALPLPALDGGQLFFLCIEAISQRKFDQKVQEEINGIAVLILLFITLSAAIGDIGKIVNGI